MPQMSPFNWTVMNMLFILALYLTMVKIFSTTIHHITISSYLQNIKCLNFTWTW